MPNDSVSLSDSLVAGDSLIIQDSVLWADPIGVSPLFVPTSDSLILRPLTVCNPLDWHFFPAYSISEVQGTPNLPNHERTYFPPDVFILLLLTSVTFFVIIRANFYKFFGQVFTAVYDARASSRIFSARTELYRNMSVYLNLLFLINISLFVHELAWWYRLPVFVIPLVLSVVLVGAAVGVVYLVKYMICKFLGAIFMRAPFFDEYQHNVFVFHKAYGALLVIPVFCIPFVPMTLTPFLIGATLGIAVLLLLLFVVRCFQIIVVHRFPVFYFLLYLCTLEIIPVLIFIKAIQKII